METSNFDPNSCLTRRSHPLYSCLTHLLDYNGRDKYTMVWHLEATVKPTVVCSRPLCTYCGIFSPKKNGFFEKEKFPQKKPAHPTANSPKSIFHIIKMSHQASVLLSVLEALHYNYSFTHKGSSGSKWEMKIIS
jgi:hypothetical protein